MVNKPASLYREDAQRAFEAERLVLLEHLRQRQLEALALDNSSLYTSLANSGSNRGLTHTPSGVSRSQESAAERLRTLLRTRQVPAELRRPGLVYSPISETFIRYPTHSSSLPSRPPSAFPVTRPLLPHRLITSDGSAMGSSRNLPSHISPQRASLRGRSINSNLPELLYAHLDTGFFFECYISTTESGSYISQDLFDQIQPPPAFTPCEQDDRLVFNGESYQSLGSCSFSMKITSDDGESGGPLGLNESKCVEIDVTAHVVVNLYPDMFLGRDHTIDEMSGLDT